MISIPALAAPYVIDGVNHGPKDGLYEYRTIVMDAQRAWKMKEPLHRALSWEKGTKQYIWWMGAYVAARDAS